MASSKSRFADIATEEKCIEGPENENIKEKTEQNVALLKEIFALKDESRPEEEILPHKLSSFISEFIILRKKENNEDDEPNSSGAIYNCSFQAVL